MLFLDCKDAFGRSVRHTHIPSTQEAFLLTVEATSSNMWQDAPDVRSIQITYLFARVYIAFSVRAVLATANNVVTSVSML